MFVMCTVPQISTSFYLEIVVERISTKTGSGNDAATAYKNIPKGILNGGGCIISHIITQAP